MKTLVIVSIVFGALLPMFVSGATLKVVGSKIVGLNRYVLYENCGWIAPINAYTVPGSTVGCVNLPSGTTPPGYVNVCGWSGFVNPNCQYVECIFADIPGAYGFVVDTPTPTTCDIDRDGAKFQYGFLPAIACCP